MTLLEIIKQKRVHLNRLANTSGTLGEQSAVMSMESWVPRPQGKQLSTLLTELAATGIHIKRFSFDAICTPVPLDFSDVTALREVLPSLIFIEIKSANQSRVKPGFDGYFFALTENEIQAAEQLGKRHKVALFNRQTEELLLTSVPEILARAKSTTWQLSIQL